MTQVSRGNRPGVALPIRIHELLLGLAGRLDDDALADARQMLASAELDRSLEFVAGCLAAGGVVLTGTQHRELEELFASTYLDPSVIDRVPVHDNANAYRHRFAVGAVDGREPDRGVAEAIRPVLDVLPDVRSVWCVWRLTPAGPVSGPVPHRLVLVGVGPGGFAPATAYRVEYALRRAGIRASVEVLVDGAQPTDYHQEAMRCARQVPFDDPGPGGGGGRPTMSPVEPARAEPFAEPARAQSPGAYATAEPAKSQDSGSDPVPAKPFAADSPVTPVAAEGALAESPAADSSGVPFAGGSATSPDPTPSLADSPVVPFAAGSAASPDSTPSLADSSVVPSASPDSTPPLAGTPADSDVPFAAESSAPTVASAAESGAGLPAAEEAARFGDAPVAETAPDKPVVDAPAARPFGDSPAADVPAAFDDTPTPAPFADPSAARVEPVAEPAASPFAEPAARVEPVATPFAEPAAARVEPVAPFADPAVARVEPDAPFAEPAAARVEPVADRPVTPVRPFAVAPAPVEPEAPALPSPFAVEPPKIDSVRAVPPTPPPPAERPSPTRRMRPVESIKSVFEQEREPEDDTPAAQPPSALSVDNPTNSRPSPRRRADRSRHEPPSRPRLAPVAPPAANDKHSAAFVDDILNTQERNLLRELQDELARREKQDTPGPWRSGRHGKPGTPFDQPAQTGPMAVNGVPPHPESRGYGSA